MKIERRFIYAPRKGTDDSMNEEQIIASTYEDVYKRQPWEFGYFF